MQRSILDLAFIDPNWVTLILGLLLAAGVALLVILAIKSYLSNPKDTAASADVVKSIFTSAGILFAVCFYFLERRGQPHADVSQSVQVAKLPGNNVMIEGYVTVKNLGNRLLEIRHINANLQVLDLERIGLGDLAKKDKDEYWGARQKDGQPAFNQAELEWPQLRYFHQNVAPHEIEPGETDLITETFVIPCASVEYLPRSARILRLATDLLKDPTDEEQPSHGADGRSTAKETKPTSSVTGKLAWKARSMVDLRSFCTKVS